MGSPAGQRKVLPFSVFAPSSAVVSCHARDGVRWMCPADGCRSSAVCARGPPSGRECLHSIVVSQQCRARSPWCPILRRDRFWSRVLLGTRQSCHRSWSSWSRARRSSNEHASGFSEPKQLSIGPSSRRRYTSRRWPRDNADWRFSRSRLRSNQHHPWCPLLCHSRRRRSTCW